MERIKTTIASGSLASERPTKIQATTNRIMDYVIGGVMALIFFATPLFFTGTLSQGVGLEKMLLFYLLVLIGTVAWVTKGIINGELTLKKTPLDFPIIGLLLFFIISTIFSVNRTDSIIGSYGNSARGLVATMVFVLFYYFLVNNVNAQRMKTIFLSFVASASLVAVYAALQLKGIFILPFAFSKAISFNPIGSISSLTIFLVLALPLLVVAAAQIGEIAPKLKPQFANIIKGILSVVTLIAVGVLCVLNGYTFWPVAILGVVITLIFFLSRVVNISSQNMAIPVAAFMILIVFLILGNFNFFNMNLPTEVSLSRSASWDVAKSSLKNDPFFGSGPSTFYYGFAKYKGETFNSSPLWYVRFDNASGSLYEFLAGVGVLGTLSVIVLVLIALSIAFLSLIKTRERGEQSILLALFASFVAAGIFSLIFAFNNSLIIIVVMIAASMMAVAINIYPEKFKELNLSFRSSPKYALALATIFLSISAGVVILLTLGIKMYIGDIYATRAMAAGDLNQRIDLMNKALLLAPYQDKYYLNLANYYMTAANQEAVTNKDQNVIQSDLSLAIENGKKAIDIAPEKADNNEALALIYENASFYLRDALDWSEKLYTKVMDLDPDSPTPYLRVALINMARANAQQDPKEAEYYINEAIKKYDQATAKKSDFASAYYGKAVAYEKLNKNDQAIEELKKAVILDSGNVDYKFELGRLYFNRGVSKQPNINQKDSAAIANGTGEGSNLSVNSGNAGQNTTINDDLRITEQLFLNILAGNPNHANSIYSLALLYQKLGLNDAAKTRVQQLLSVLTDPASIDLVKKQFPKLY